MFGLFSLCSLFEGKANAVPAPSSKDDMVDDKSPDDAAIDSKVTMTSEILNQRFPPLRLLKKTAMVDIPFQVYSRANKVPKGSAVSDSELQALVSHATVAPTPKEYKALTRVAKRGGKRGKKGVKRGAKKSDDAGASKRANKVYSNAYHSAKSAAIAQGLDLEQVDFENENKKET